MDLAASMASVSTLMNPADMIEEAVHVRPDGSQQPFHRVRTPILFSGIVLATWDNIVGPSINQVWAAPETTGGSFFDKLLPFVARCTLNGEIMRERVGADVPELKFYTLNDLGYVMVSFIFTSLVDKDKDTGLFSLNLILPLEQMHVYLSIHQLCFKRTCAFIKRLRVLICSEFKSKDVNDFLEPLHELLIPMLQTLNSIGIQPIPSVVDMRMTVFAPGNETVFELAFLRLAITSHLQTGGVTVVLGPQKSLINMLIESLAMFLTRDERQQSRYAQDEGDLSYAPDLYLQGILQTEANMEVTAEELMQTATPSTIINLKDMTVRQTKQRNEYTVIRVEQESIELQRLEATMGETTASQATPVPHGMRDRNTRFLYHAISVSALVHGLLDQLFKPHSIHVRQAIIEQFRRSLDRQAFVLIQFVDASNASPTHALTADQIRKMQKQMLLEKGDFDIVLAFAEKLRKDISFTLLGDAKKREAEFVDLFSDF